MVETEITINEKKPKSQALKEAKKRYYQKIKNNQDYKDRVMKNSKNYYEKNKEEIKESSKIKYREYYQKNKEKVLINKNAYHHRKKNELLEKSLEKLEICGDLSQLVSKINILCPEI
jgi:hypothetical protein